ncbi:MAG: hypothetical protein U1F43_11725 [Myxococcota bacterium]
MPLLQREQAQQKSPTSQSPDAATEKKARPIDLVPEENKAQTAGASAPPSGNGPAVQKKDEGGTPAPTPTAAEQKTGTPPAADAKQGDDKKEADPKAPANDAKAAEDKKKEEERTKAVTAQWEGLLGKWLGGPLAKIVLEEVSVAKLNGYVNDGLKAAGPAIGSALKDATKPDAAQEKGLKDFSDALAGVMTGLVDSWVKSDSGQKVLTKISQWVQDNPGWVMSIVGTALIGGAIAAWFANPDVKFDVPLGLPKGWEMKAGIDLGKLQNMGFQGASLVVANKNQAIKMAASVSNKDTKENGEVTKNEKGGKLAINVGKDEDQHAAFVMNGTITETKDGLVAHTMGGSLDLVDPKTGAKVSISKEGKWDSKGNKEDSFSYSAQAGTDVTGSFSCNLKDAVVVDEKGNIHTLSSQAIKVAVGDKAGKFNVSIGQKTETKDGKESTTTEIGASAKGQLGAGTLFEGQSNISIGEDKVVVKLNGKMETTIGGKKVTFDGSYQTDGEITGKIKVGDGDAYREIKGTKKGDQITFSTVDVFKGGQVEQKMTADEKTGKTGQQTTATANLGANTKMTMSGGSEGSKVGVDTKVGDNTSLSANAGTDANGQFQGGASVKYTTDMLKMNLDAEMKNGKGSLGLGASLNTPEGFKFDANLKLDDTRITEMALKFGYKDPNAFRTFLVGYKRTWMQDNQQYADHFDALLEYSFGKFQARASGGVDLMGGKLQKTNLDLGGAYSLNDKWKLVGGMQMNGMMNNDTNRMQQSFKPYVGAQYGNVGVAGYYDTGSKSAGVMLTIPF